jgi:hypothetical protein
MDDNLKLFMKVVGGPDIREVEVDITNGSMMNRRDMEIGNDGMILGRHNVTADIGVDIIRDIIILINGLDQCVRQRYTLLEVGQYRQREDMVLLSLIVPPSLLETHRDPAVPTQKPPWKPHQRIFLWFPTNT